jgi:DNA polymerase III subunit delta
MIIFLYGKDEFRSTKKLAEIKNKFLEKNKEGSTLFVFDFSEKEIDAEDLVVKLSSGGLFSNKKLAIIKNALQNKKFGESEEILNFLKKLKKKEDKDLAITFWERDGFEKKAKLTKYLLANAKSQEFKFLEGAKILNWIREEISRKGKGEVSISSGAAQKIAAFMGADNLSLLDCELEKLINYKGKGEIAEEDVDLLVKSKINTDVFKTVDALSRNDKKSAIKLLHSHLSSGDDPFYLLSMYFYQFRNLLKIKPLADRHIPEREIVQKLKLHPFVVRKSLTQCRNFSLSRLKEIYKDLCDLDYEAKTGKAEIEMALDRLVVSV